MLKHHPLVRLHAVHAAIKDAAHRHVWRIVSAIIHAGVALVSQPHLHFSRSRRADHNAKVRRQNHIRVLAGLEIRFQRSLVKRHHQPRRLARAKRSSNG